MPWHGWTVIRIGLIPTRHIKAITIIDLSDHIIIPHHHIVSVDCGHHRWGWWRWPITGLYMRNYWIRTHWTTSLRLVEPQRSRSFLGARITLTVKEYSQEINWLELLPKSVGVGVLLHSISKVFPSSSTLLCPIIICDLQCLCEEIEDQGHVDEPQKEASECNAHHDSCRCLSTQ